MPVTFSKAKSVVISATFLSLISPLINNYHTSNLLVLFIFIFVTTVMSFGVSSWHSVSFDAASGSQTMNVKEDLRASLCREEPDDNVIFLVRRLHQG